jgi:prepilin-type N-terminal cleavage/methylation domain-containing protein
MKPRAHSCRRGFTLIEVMLAMVAGALVLAAIYGIFTKAIHLRNAATERIRVSRVRARAELTIRNDLRNAVVSGGVLAAYLEGSRDGHTSNFPGYLKFVAATGRTLSDQDTGSDLQQVEYYIVSDPDADAGAAKSGLLVRAITRDLLATTQPAPVEESLLPGVDSMDITFYNGQSWINTWKFSTTDVTLPTAVRVVIQPSASPTGGAAKPIEICVPWTTQPEIDLPTTTTTTAASGSGT